MEKYRGGPAKPEHGYDSSKTVKSKSGFEVLWHNAVQTTTRKPGINIKFCRPDGQIKEDTFFEFGQEIAAQTKFDSHVATLKQWKELE